MNTRIALFFDLFKLRIGLVIGVTALAGVAVVPEAGPSLWPTVLRVFAVVVSSAAAGAFNQYVERHIDARMVRTRARPFVTGRLQASPRWLALIVVMSLGSIVVATLATNVLAALYTFLGAFVYGVVYTVWLKRRTWLNIVIGGLAGSFAVLAGAAAVAPDRLDGAPLWLAVVLFLWTPPHFWSLAIAYRKDYEATGVPMLPVVVGDARAAQAILASAALLVCASLVVSRRCDRRGCILPGQERCAGDRALPAHGDGELPRIAGAAVAPPRRRHRRCHAVALTSHAGCSLSRLSRRRSRRQQRSISTARLVKARLL